MMRHRFRYGPLVFRDPLLLCGALYVLLYFCLLYTSDAADD